MKSSKLLKGNKKPHGWAEALFEPYLDGELDPKRRRKLQDHLKECKACREAFEEEKTLLSRLAGALGPEEIPKRYDIADSVTREIKSLDEGGVLKLIKRLFPSGSGPMLRPSFSYTIAAVAGISIGLFSGMFTPGSSNGTMYINSDSSYTSSLDYMIEKISYSEDESITNLYFGSETEDTNE